MEETNSNAGKIFLCMIGLMLMFAGGVFEWLMFRSYMHAKETREWPQVEAVVLRSVIDERQIQGSPPEFRLSLLYGYTFKNEDLTSDQIAPPGCQVDQGCFGGQGTCQGVS